MAFDLISTAPSETAPVVKHKFVLWAPDSTEEDVTERRVKIRPRHLEYVRTLHEQGTLAFGAATLTPESVKGQKAMNGSLVIYETETIEQAWEAAKNDVFYVHKVWDTEKMTILPFMASFPWPSN